LPLFIPGQLVASRRHGGVSNDAGSQRAVSSPRRSLTFEVDGVDQDRQLGWNAVVRGPTGEVTDSINSPDFGPFPSWRGTPARPPPRYLRIKSSQVIGMRITIADLPQNWQG
jgi:hypothetical protein